MGWRNFDISTYPHDKTDKSDKSPVEKGFVSKKRFVIGGTPESESCQEGPDSAISSRNLSVDELARLDLRLRVIAPSDADTWTLEDWLDWIAERASILEFDGEYSREQADQEALLLCRLYRHKEVQS